jgi:hypothetical protein
MAPALLVDLGLEAIRHPRCRAFVRHITGRAGHSGTAAITAVRPVPQPFGMILTNPSGVPAEDALHRSHQTQRQRKPGNLAGRTQVCIGIESEILELSPRAVYP